MFDPHEGPDSDIPGIGASLRLGVTSVTHTPRFTAKAPDTRAVVRRFRRDRCTSVKACDKELRELVGRLHRTTHPETVAGLHADMDEVLDLRIKLAFDEAAELAMQLARRPL